MSSKLDNFARSIRRHGTWRTGLRYLYKQLNRVVTFDIYRVQSGYTEDPGKSDVDDYDLRAVNESEFHRHLCSELQDHDLHWAFARGDLCFAAWFEDEIVAYDIRSKHDAPFEEGLVLQIPPGFWYGTLSITAPSHRGRGIARELWVLANQTITDAEGMRPPKVWTVSVFNLESRAAIRRADTGYLLHGYAGYFKMFGKWYTFASPGCRKLGAGFRRSES